MKNILLTVLLVLIGSLGYVSSLVHLYASPDGVAHTLYGSIEYFATSLFIFAFLFNLDKKTPTPLKWINSLLTIAFAMFGLILSLIASYASPSQVSEPLASVFFFVSAMVSSSGIFFLFKTTRTSSSELT